MQLSSPSALMDNCWAEDNQRILLVGIRKGEQRELRNVLAQFAQKHTYVEESCFGTNVTGKLKCVVDKQPETLRRLMQALQDNGIITDEERGRASYDLGLRMHQMPQTVEVGAGI
jgi:hypothetical protein